MDGSVKNGVNDAAWGGVIRNQQCYWIGGFSCNLGACSVLMEELNVIAIALEMA